MRIAIVGIQGLPNQYGGFETLSEFLVKYLGKENDFTVYCSGIDQKEEPEVYKGAKLKYYEITSHGGKGILFDCKCLWDAASDDYDVILIRKGIVSLHDVRKEFMLHCEVIPCIHLAPYFTVYYDL